MGDAESERLFPDKLHFLTFAVYISLFVNQGILVTWSKNPDGTYSYNTTTVVLLSECLKLVMAVALFLKVGMGRVLFSSVEKVWRALSEL